MDFNKYENRLEYPRTPQKPHLYPDASPEQARQHADSLKQYDIDMSKWHKVINAYREEQNRLMALFRQDALAAVGLAEYSKRNAVFNYAWKKNRGYDLQTVFGALCELAGLIEIVGPALTGS